MYFWWNTFGILCIFELRKHKSWITNVLCLHAVLKNFTFCHQVRGFSLLYLLSLLYNPTCDMHVLASLVLYTIYSYHVSMSCSMTKNGSYFSGDATSPFLVQNWNVAVAAYHLELPVGRFNRYLLFSNYNSVVVRV